MERPASKMTQQKAHRTIRQDHEDHATKYGKDFAIKDCRRGDIRSDPAGEKLHCTTFISTHRVGKKMEPGTFSEKIWKKYKKTSEKLHSTTFISTHIVGKTWVQKSLRVWRVSGVLLESPNDNNEVQVKTRQ